MRIPLSERILSHFYPKRIDVRAISEGEKWHGKKCIYASIGAETENIGGFDVARNGKDISDVT